ncbi:MAG: magnesium transporter [Planctomycetota bacterium]|jgi:magnesium transporter
MSTRDRGEQEREPQATPRERLRSVMAGTQEDLAAVLLDLHEADIAEGLLDMSAREAWVVFDSLGVEERGEVLACAEDSLREQLLERLTPRQIAEIVDGMAPDDVVDLLALSDRETAEHVLRSVEEERAKNLRRLAAFPPDSAGGLMTTDFIVVTEGGRIGDAIKLLKYETEEAEEGSGLFVIDGKQRPVGYVPDRDLLRHSIHDTVDSVMADPILVPVEMDQEEVARQIVHYGLNEIAVVDANGAIVGVVSADDAQDVLEEEANEDMLRMVGTSPELQTRLPVLRRVRARLPLQGLTVIGGLVTAWIISQALGATSQKVDLLRFIPIIIGLAGNVGIQASTILVRAFATGEVERDREASVLGSETLVGLIIGTICGGTTGVFLLLTQDSPESAHFALAISVAITSAVTWAAFLGCVVPMACRRVGIDPAIVAGPFLITVSDISGTALYLGVARLVVGV